MSKHFNPMTRRREEGAGDPIGLGQATCRAQTDKAILVVLEDDGRALWIPQSCIHADSEVWQHGQNGRVVVLSWFAAKEGFT